MAGIGLVSALGPGSGGAAVMGGAAPAWWVVAGKTCVAAYQPKGAADLATSYINLANPGVNNAAPVGAAPTWDVVNGWKFDHTVPQALDTTVTGLGISWTIIVQFSNHIAGSAAYYLTGVQSTTAQWFAFGSSYFATRRYFNNPNLNAGAGALSGNIALAGLNAYFNGAPDGVVGGAGFTGAMNASVYIGAGSNLAGAVSNPSTFYAQAYAMYSGTLVAGDVAALRLRMVAL